MHEFDALLGGGIVAGSLVLLGGPPGAGKSTLLLQIANALSERGAQVIYVCGEESAAQTKLRAGRVGASDELLVYPETNLRAILDECERRRPAVMVVDSIQTMALPEVESFAGSVSQVRDCTQALVEFASGPARRSSSSVTSPRMARSPVRDCSSTSSTPCSTRRRLDR